MLTAILFAATALGAKSGVFITKPNPWSPASEVDETKFFTDIEDHNGYLVVTLQDGSSEDIDRACLTALIYRPAIPAVIPDNATLTYLKNEETYLRGQVAAHPTARLLIEQWISVISHVVASYNGPAPDAATAQATPPASEELVTNNGKHYQNFTISRIEPDGLVLVTNSGIEKVLFTDLPESVQEEFDYDPAKAAQFQADEKAAAAQRDAARDQQIANAKRQEAMAELAQNVDKSAIAISGSVIAVSGDGVLLTNAALKVRAMHDVVTYQNPLDGSVITTPKPGFDTVASDGPIFVYGVTGLADGDVLPETKVYPVPDYSYDDAANEHKTVRAFSASKDMAIQLLLKLSQ